MRTLRRLAIGLAVAAFGSLSLAGGASATFHLMKIRQIHPSNNINGGDWVQLQMYAAGQNQVAGKFIKTYDSVGTEFSEYQITGATPSNAQSQRSILISSAITPAGVDADFVAPVADLQIPGDNGAVCFQDNNLAQTVIDCVAYGSFSGALPATPPAVATPFGSTLERSIARNCSTLLENADDTNDSAADFAISTDPPRNNDATPTEHGCASASKASCGGLKATRVGNGGPNVLTGTPGRDVIAGLGGKDKLKGLGGNDVICGGRGRDRLIGGPGRDKLLGQAGGDFLKGGPGKDKLKGGPGRDAQIQ
jgi:hypothetical protein